MNTQARFRKIGLGMYILSPRLGLQRGTNANRPKGANQARHHVNKLCMYLCTPYVYLYAAPRMQIGPCTLKAELPDVDCLSRSRL